jgi:hypothetical protein
MEWQSGLNNEDHVSIGTTMLDEMLLQVHIIMFVQSHNEDHEL